MQQQQDYLFFNVVHHTKGFPSRDRRSWTAEQVGSSPTCHPVVLNRPGRPRQIMKQNTRCLKAALKINADRLAKSRNQKVQCRPELHEQGLNASVGQLVKEESCWRRVGQVLHQQVVQADRSQTTIGRCRMAG